MDGQALVKTARKIIEDQLSGSKVSESNVKGIGGIFVTLTKDGDLRGCIDEGRI